MDLNELQMDIVQVHLGFAALTDELRVRVVVMDVVRQGAHVVEAV